MPANKQQLRQERRRQLEERPLHPDFFYRVSDGHKFFGYRSSALAEKIKTGDIPPPIPLSDTGRAKGWFGRAIIAWQQEREAKAAGKAA
jgi:predicted DNA-binding transcriptional regulator AlpA